jgi:hypothetical protein
MPPRLPCTNATRNDGSNPNPVGLQDSLPPAIREAKQAQLDALTGNKSKLLDEKRADKFDRVYKSVKFIGAPRFLTERPSARTERTPLTPHDAQEHSALRPSSDFLPAFLGGLRGCRLSLSEAGEAAYLQSNRR